jgi:autotransporter-associated beta strand protein
MLTKAGTGTLTLTGTSTYSGGTTVIGGLVNVAAVANLGTGPVTLNGGGLQWANGSSADLSSLGLTLGSAGGTLATTDTAVTLASAITGTGSLSKQGASDLYLTSNNTYTGGTTVTAGRLWIGSGATTGSVVGDIINNGSNLFFNRSDAITFAGNISGTGEVAQFGSGTLTLTGNNTHPTTVVYSGTLVMGSAGAIGTGLVILRNTGMLDTASYGIDLGRIVSSDASSVLTGSGAFSYNSATNKIIEVQLTGTAILTKSGTGTLTLSGANTYTGITTVSAGILQLGNGGTTGSITGNVTNNAALVFNRSDDFIFAGTISGSGSLTKVGANEVTLTAANTYSGGTTLSDGYLNLRSAGTLGTGPVTNNTYLQFFDSTSAGSAALTNTWLIYFNNNSSAGTATITNPGMLQFYHSSDASTATINNGTSGQVLLQYHTGDFSLGALAGGGTVALGSNTLTVGQLNTTTTFDGIISGTGSLTKVGTGTLTLSGVNTYTGGTTVDAGTLALGASGSLGDSAAIRIASGATLDVSAVSGGFTLNSGQTLSGTGSVVGPLTLASGAHLAPGNSPGTLAFTGGLTLTGGSILDFQLGTTSDLIRVSGGTLSGPLTGLVTLNLANAGGFTAGTYTLFDFTSAATSSFDVGDFTFGSTLPGYTYALALAGSTLELTATASAIPEPSTYAALAGALALGLAAYRRRQGRAANFAR